MKKILLVIITMICIAVLCSCKENTKTPPAPSVPEKTKQVSINSSGKPAVIMSESSTFSGVSATYPHVSGTGADIILNEEVIREISAFAAEYASSVDEIEYKITYNDRGILSILLYATNKTDQTVLYHPITFNSQSGGRITLDTLFESDNDTWKNVAAFYAETLVRLNRTDTHSDVKITEDKDFYLTDTKLVIFYELYEISYYAQGSPYFEIPYSVLEQYANPDGAMHVILEGRDVNE